jgi:hypothetical protein
MRDLNFADLVDLSSCDCIDVVMPKINSKTKNENFINSLFCIIEKSNVHDVHAKL